MLINQPMADQIAALPVHVVVIAIPLDQLRPKLGNRDRNAFAEGINMTGIQLIRTDDVFPGIPGPHDINSVRSFRVGLVAADQTKQTPENK
ncbi:hypothetical protein BWI97_02760 [Siphonobacter sp. BAB-5405]|nr:hypothetical protein BWI97_02760 [Siphonobacter sp. BAB-5405]